MPAKLPFLGDVAHNLSEFLRGFQINNHMMPFLFGSLETMICCVMKMFIKGVLNEPVTAFRLIEIKVSEISNQLAIGDVKLTTAREALLKSCSVDNAAKENFRRDCVTFLLRMVQKLQEKSLLKYQIFHCLNWFVPKAMTENKEECVVKFDKIIGLMHKKGHLSSKEADDAKYQFDDFIDNIGQKNFEMFSRFDWGKDRLDDFYGQWWNKSKTYSSFWKVLIFSFALSHGQSESEHGFNINDNLLVENLKTKSFTAQRSVQDFINASEVSVDKMEIDNVLIKSCKAVYSMYKEALEDKKIEDEKCRRRNLILQKINKMKHKKQELQSYVDVLEKKVEKYNDKAEKDHCIESMMKGNSFRNTVTGKKINI